LIFRSWWRTSACVFCFEVRRLRIQGFWRWLYSELLNFNVNYRIFLLLLFLVTVTHNALLLSNHSLQILIITINSLSVCSCSPFFSACNSSFPTYYLCFNFSIWRKSCFANLLALIDFYFILVSLFYTLCLLLIFLCSYYLPIKLFLWFRILLYFGCLPQSLQRRSASSWLIILWAVTGTVFQFYWCCRLEQSRPYLLHFFDCFCRRRTAFNKMSWLAIVFNSKEAHWFHF